MHAGRRRDAYDDCNAWCWRTIGTIVMLVIMLIMFTRVFADPLQMAEADCIDTRDEAQMMLESVCANPARRARQKIDHCSRYLIRNETTIPWCKWSTVLTPASVYRAFGGLDPSWTLFVVVFAFGSVSTCCVIFSCCTTLHLLQGHRNAMTLPTDVGSMYAVSSAAAPPPSVLYDAGAHAYTHRSQQQQAGVGSVQYVEMPPPSSTHTLRQRAVHGGNGSPHQSLAW